MLVNGEAVEVDLRVARLGSRALALMIDMAVQAALAGLLWLITLLFFALLPGDVADEALVSTAGRVLVVLVFIAYPTALETFTNGRSIGKRAMGLRVVREDGGPIRIRHALTRALVGVSVEWPGLLLPLLTWVVSMGTMIASPQGRRLGDLAAGTLVIHERAPATWGWVPAMPPHLAPWAAALDLSDLDDDLALAGRNFLARLTDIREPQRSRFAYTLANEVGARIRQAPPPGTPMWVFLAAVLAERRRRAGEAVYTTRELTDRIWPGFGRPDRHAVARALARDEPVAALAKVPRLRSSAPY
ncbi:MAG: hypothetical protein QOC94_2399 [Actinoplanes sp.]|jgi:uncharacterized RDD family membrane protein YckC|nr:hypothetical protein [Actinoplanes sp.]